MKTLANTPDLICRYSVLGSFAAQDFAPRPTFQNVVGQWFKDALEEQFPYLDADFTRLWIAEPLATAATDNGQPRRYRFMAPVDVIMQSYLDATSVTLTQGFHRLTTDKDRLDPHPLAVDMAQLQTLINDRSPLLIDAYQQALAAFWSTAANGRIAPVQWLRQVLQSSLRSVADDQSQGAALADEQRVALMVVAVFADRAERVRGSEETPLRAYLVNIESTGPSGLQRFQLPGVAVITRQMQERLIVLGYSLEQGVEAFNSLQMFATLMLPRLLEPLAIQSLSWSLHEPEGDFFVALGLTLLDRQLQDIAVLGQTARRDAWSVGRLEQELDAAAAMFAFFRQPESPYLEQVMASLPAWLNQAAPADLLAYSRLLLAQVVWQQQNLGQTFLEGVDSLQVFAEKKIRQYLELDHPESVDDLDIAQIEIHDLGIESLQLAFFNDDVMPFVEFVLTYRGGWPIGLIDVRDRRGTSLPQWLTGAYVRRLVDQLDVGTQYIALIKQLLVDDDNVAQRQALFESQLKVQLPLFALEKKIRGEAGFTGQGVQTLIRLMRPDAQSSAGHDHVCVRPLGFHAYDGAEVDVVANMFIFGSLDTAAGPFILYRPFTVDPLLEFATWPALFEAIKQPGPLQESILTWMGDDARGYYADGGFERPHLEGYLLEGFLALLARSPARLSTQAVVGDYMEAMFDANASALISMADRQTVSTSERRWILLKHYGWSLFNGLTFFLSGPLQKSAWLLQTLLNLDSGLQARLDGDKDAARQTVIDLLFNISLALLHEGLKFKAQANPILRSKPPVDEPMFSIYDPGPLAVAHDAPAPVVKILAGTDSSGAVSEYSAMDFSWFNSQPQLSASQRTDLARFALSIDLAPGTRIETGPLKGLIKLGDKTYVQIDGSTYRVSRQPDGLVIQSDRQPDSLGPWLKADDSGHWALDLRLRLRGGGPKKRIQALREKKQEKVVQLKQQINHLLDELQARERRITVTEGLLDRMTDRREQFLERYESEVESWRLQVLQVLELNSKSNKLIPIHDYAFKEQETWVGLALRLFKLQNYLEQALRQLPMQNIKLDYGAEMLDVLAQIEAGSSGPYLQWVEQLKQTEKLEARLFRNSLYEIAALDEIKKRPLPKGNVLLEIMDKPDRDYFDRHWAAAYLETLCELLIRRDALDLTPEEQSAFDLFGQRTLSDTIWSQLNLRRTGLLYASEHIGFFDQTIQTYEAAESVCARLIDLESENIRNEYLAPMINVLTTLREFAEAQMASLIRDSESSSSEQDEPRPGPSRLAGAAPGKAGPAQKIIKTTNKQTLVGVRRESVSDSGEDIVDVTEGIDRLKVRSFRQISGGEWEEIGGSRPPSSQASLSSQASRPMTINRLESQARTLLGGIDDAIAQNRTRAHTARIPVEIEEILGFKARVLDEVAGQIEESVRASRPDVQALTEARRTEVQMLGLDLKSAATRLREEGRKLRISIIKRLPPTGPGIDYLKTQGEIRIDPAGPRRYLSRGQRKDYLQEYVISDLDGTELWYAHFHYKTRETPVSDYDVAHLKTVQQRTWNEQALYAKARSSKDFIEVYRAKLERDLAERLFLSMAQPAQSSV